MAYSSRIFLTDHRFDGVAHPDVRVVEEADEPIPVPEAVITFVILLFLEGLAHRSRSRVSSFSSRTPLHGLY